MANHIRNRTIIVNAVRNLDWPWTLTGYLQIPETRNRSSQRSSQRACIHGSLWQPFQNQIIETPKENGEKSREAAIPREHLVDHDEINNTNGFD